MSAKDYFTCSLKHRLHGIEFTIQSPQIEEAMRHVSGGRIIRGNPEIWSGLSLYHLDIGANGIPVCFPGFSLGRFDMWGNREMLCAREPKINLSLLLAVGLADGVKVTVPTVMSPKQLDQYLAGLKSAVRQFYIDFLKESECHIRITTEVIS